MRRIIMQFFSKTQTEYAWKSQIIDKKDENDLKIGRQCNRGNS